MKLKILALAAVFAAPLAFGQDAATCNDVGMAVENGVGSAGRQGQVFVPNACPPAGFVDAAFTGATTQLGRIFRDGIAGACPSKVYPGIFNPANTYNYEKFTYRNTSAATACVTVNFDPNTLVGTPCATNAHASAYLGSYDPLNQATNYVGDVGSSITQPFAFDVPASTDMVLVVTNTSSQAVCNFAFQVVNLPCSTFAKGDFNNDGLSDLVFRNVADATSNKVWFMDGVTRTSEAAITPAATSADWLVRGTDDFDSFTTPGTPGGDGVNDLVFWNQTTGAVEFWAMNGLNRPGAAVPLTGGAPLNVAWDLSATGDFNADGRPDIVWRNFTSQKIVIWKMGEGAVPGTQKTGNIIPSPDQAVAFNWIIVAAADYNNDANTDFLWYNITTGKIVTWYMDASAVRITGQFTTPDAAGANNWKVVASSDYSRNYTPGTPPLASNDIVWRNATSGAQVVWHLDFNSTRVHGQFTNPSANALAGDAGEAALDWVIVGPR